MSPDPKWLAVLNDLDFVLAAFIACLLFLLANHLGWLPPLSWTNPLLFVWFALFFLGPFLVLKALGAFLDGLRR